MVRASAYRLHERAGAEGFAEAWDIAIACGADLQFHTALDQAINGVTTVRVMRGGMVEVMNAPDRKVLKTRRYCPKRACPRRFRRRRRRLKRQGRHEKCAAWWLLSLLLGRKRAA
jgi:hypothetical protein